MERTGFLDTSRIIRITKIALLAFFGIYAGLVVIGNIVDPNSNLTFVNHVLSMDTTFQNPELEGRAITNAALHRVAFWTIVLIEALVCVLCLFGAGRLTVASRRDAVGFHAAKGPGILGLLLGLALWFFGFQAVGGEWFASWQSPHWNGLDSANRITIFLLGSLVFVGLRND